MDGSLKMKRSEMVINIAIELMGHFPELKKQERRQIADEILQSIEISGMMPPRWVPEDHGYLYGDEPSGEPNGFEIGIYKWEPENEEK
jgi:hypothetical protein